MPTLCRLVMATPRTIIEQTVGRILRSNHEMPVVVDIVDTHDLFQKQWLKRKTYYRKEKYAILKTTSTKYTTDLSSWEKVFTPIFEKADATNNKRKVASAKATNSIEEEVEDEKEEPVVKRNCTIDLSMFA